MNKNYHYFVVKTLAVYAGFGEDDAQLIAHFSQQIDDFILGGRVLITQRPPEFFTANGYAREIGKLNLWLFAPHPTGIDDVSSVMPEYQKNTIAPFHFIPAQTLASIDSVKPVDRNKYRCVCAGDPGEKLINTLVCDAVNAVKTDKNQTTLMRLGMALHTYADTYAHCHYSGFNGWENHSSIKKAVDVKTGKEEVSEFEKTFYEKLPPIGHANTGHAPDICDYDIELAMKSKEGAGFEISRSNKESFSKCSREILDLLCEANRRERFTEAEWQELRGRLEDAEDVKKETDADKLAAHWGKCFTDIPYHYNKGDYFYISAYASGPSGTQPPENTGEDAADIYSPRNDAVQLSYIVTITQADEAFFTYNQIAYEWAAKVAGCGLQKISDGEAGTYLKKAGAVNAGGDSWKPRTDLALMVQAAGFLYEPNQDILYSSLTNMQRLAGYCKAYDELAPAIGSYIDSEPIYFVYNGFEWMIELWKGQYGIETGCEIGVYKREAGKPLDPLEKILGKVYQCVPNADMPIMSFRLLKGDRKLFTRGPEKHWWLTGFRWGVYSEPSDLSVYYTVKFKDEGMCRAFVGDESSGLKGLGYSYERPDSLSADFVFSKPFSPQPEFRTESEETLRKSNKALCAEYNKIKAAHEIAGDDPNAFNEELLEGASEDLRKWFGGLNSVRAKETLLRSKTAGLRKEA
ncbi:MAG: DUF4474 domain-containing protein [Treponema sp.]|jgi:hypothetical protein|nr:DUF4474 domain-containing protein [Treponema sp.]